MKHCIPKCISRFPERSNLYKVCVGQGVRWTKREEVHREIPTQPGWRYHNNTPPHEQHGGAAVQPDWCRQKNKKIATKPTRYSPTTHHGLVIGATTEGYMRWRKKVHTYDYYK